MKRLFAVMAFVLFTASTARAEDYIINAGTLEAMTLPDGTHLGVYSYVGGAVAFPTDHVILIPSLSLEWSPETNFWGFVGAFTADFPIKSWLGLDVIFTVTQDQYKDDWGNALFLAGPGAGFSVIVNKWTFSPSTTFYRTLNAPGWSVTTGLNIGYTL